MLTVECGVGVHSAPPIMQDVRAPEETKASKSAPVAISWATIKYPRSSWAIWNKTSRLRGNVSGREAISDHRQHE